MSRDRLSKPPCDAQRPLRRRRAPCRRPTPQAGLTARAGYERGDGVLAALITGMTPVLVRGEQMRTVVKVVAAARRTFAVDSRR